MGWKLIIKVEHNVATGEIIESEMTAEELLKMENLRKESALETELKQQAQAAKAALLEKLGITEEEAKLLLS